MDINKGCITSGQEVNLSVVFLRIDLIWVELGGGYTREVFELEKILFGSLPVKGLSGLIYEIRIKRWKSEEVIIKNETFISVVERNITISKNI